MSEVDDLKKKLRKTLPVNLDKVIKILIDKINSDKIIGKEIILIQGRYATLLRQERLNTIEADKYIVQLDKIRKAVLDLIDNLSIDDISPYNENDFNKSKNQTKSEIKVRHFSEYIFLQYQLNSIELKLTETWFTLQMNYMGINNTLHKNHKIKLSDKMRLVEKISVEEVSHLNSRKEIARLMIKIGDIIDGKYGTPHRSSYHFSERLGRFSRTILQECKTETLHETMLNTLNKFDKYRQENNGHLLWFFDLFKLNTNTVEISKIEEMLENVTPYKMKFNELLDRLKTITDVG